ncbi:MAG: hypothetical protein SFV19_19430 [Rhodospirillaceae bacterium]|nr:hypothetical protein [Rhodospirillaceae bacterium]
MTVTAQDFEQVYARFQAPISRRYDCGKKCAPLNKGIPVCCDQERAVPVVDGGEWELLKSRTDLWRIYTPKNKTEEREFGGLAEGCQSIVCKGVKFCERDNRTIACRAFPFFPYFTADKELVGLGYYWGFEGLCWVISNLTIVEKPFIDEMIAASEFIFARDADELATYITFSATMRGVFTKWNRKIPLLLRDGKLAWVLPGSGGKIVPAAESDIPTTLAPFAGDRGAEGATKEAA